MFLAVSLSMLVILGWTYAQERYFPIPKAPVSKIVSAPAATTAIPGENRGVAQPQDRQHALAQSPRIAIDTPKLKGSINLRGAVIDDLMLVDYRQELAKDSPPVVVYAPAGTKESALAGFGWSGPGAPGADTVWQADRKALTPESPVTLSWGNGSGQVFSFKISVDRNYLFTVTQSVSNHSGAPVTLAAFGYVSRNTPSADRSSSAHVGPVGAFNGTVNYDLDYTILDGQEPGFFAKLFGTTAKAGENTFASKGGWVGFGDKYWLSAVVPAQDTPLNAGFRKSGIDYRAGYVGAATPLAAGQTASVSAHLFAGAKEVNLLDDYAAALATPSFAKAIDWGWFGIICKPLFHLIHRLFVITGNFGVAVILTTFVIRGLMFPIAQRQFASMANMKVVQPKMKALQERFKDDKVALQQATMKLYQEEKINPVAGCLPIFLQIPVFFALYKVLSISLEMRHQPFVGWLHDLSAPDPILFGLMPGLQAMLPGFLAIGILPIILGITMWIMQKANPTPTMDPAQAQMMAFMPWMMMFLFASMAAGLQLYYVVSNTITIAQQQWFFKRHPVLKQQAAALPQPAK
jgi:YidC/Oxa1 family membrane protein insertase